MQGWLGSLGCRRVLGKSTPKHQMRAAGEDVLRLWSGHPHRLNDLEDGGADDYEDKEGNKFRADRVLVIVLAGSFHLAPFGDVFGVLFIRLSHLRCQTTKTKRAISS